MGSNSAYDGYENLTYFLTDGDPNHGSNNYFPENANYRNSAFEHLKEISPKVYAIGIGRGVNKNTLNQYDTTNVAQTKIENQVVADFNRNDNGKRENRAGGADRRDAWDTTAGNSNNAFKNSGSLRIRDTNSSSNSATEITLKATHKIAVTEGARLRFDANTGNWNDADEFTWQLLKWNATLNNWDVVQSGDNTGTHITTGPLAAGDYGFRFKVNDKSPGSSTARIDIDNIWILDQKVTIGQAQIVLTPDALHAVLKGGGQSTAPVPVGDDIAHGGDGNDILFGDAINTDWLPWDTPGNPAKPADYKVTGLQALKDFLEALNGHTATDAELYAYIRANHAQFNVAGDTHGGNDTLYGDAGRRGFGQWGQ